MSADAQATVSERLPEGAARSSSTNAAAWLLWLVGACALPLISRNPLYLALEFLIVSAVYLSLPRRSAAARAWRLFVLIGLSLSLLSVGFNVLTVHVGDRVFGRIPGWVPIAGGKLTWNAFAYGLVSALAIATLLIAAAAFNTGVRHGDLVRLMPSGFARLGIAGSIALTMVPQTIAAGRDIVDAQRARGHRVRGVRDAGSLVVPLLAVGMERAVTLSEALEVRGFGAPVEIPATRRGRALPVAALVALCVALAAIGAGRLLPGLAALVLALGLASRSSNANVRRTRLRRLTWNPASIAAAVGAGWTLAALLAALTVVGVTVSWDPFPRLVAPEFSPLVGAALFGLIVPAMTSLVRAP